MNSESLKAETLLSLTLRLCEDKSVLALMRIIR